MFKKKLRLLSTGSTNFIDSNFGNLYVVFILYLYNKSISDKYLFNQKLEECLNDKDIIN